ncbi:hypothetical protein RCS94_09125 [Orbaceae bacterium ac157xtp]
MPARNPCIKKISIGNCALRILKESPLKASQNGKFQKPAPRRGLRVAALGNPYRSGDVNHENNTTLKQTETTTPQIPLYK